jgi:hypothetical protein
MRRHAAVKTEEAFLLEDEFEALNQSGIFWLAIG